MNNNDYLFELKKDLENYQKSAQRYFELYQQNLGAVQAVIVIIKRMEEKETTASTT